MRDGGAFHNDVYSIGVDGSDPRLVVAGTSAGSGCRGDAAGLPPAERSAPDDRSVTRTRLGVHRAVFSRFD